MTGKANGAKFQWSLIKVRWHWAGPSLGWSPLGLVAHIKKTQNFLIFIRFEKSLLNVRSYMKEGGVLYLTWFYSMKIIRQGSSSSSFPGYDGHDATSSLLHPPAFLKHHIPEGHILPHLCSSAHSIVFLQSLKEVFYLLLVVSSFIVVCLDVFFFILVLGVCWYSWIYRFIKIFTQYFTYFCLNELQLHIYKATWNCLMVLCSFVLLSLCSEM